MKFTKDLIFTCTEEYLFLRLFLFSLPSISTDCVPNACKLRECHHDADDASLFGVSYIEPPCPVPRSCHEPLVSLSTAAVSVFFVRLSVDNVSYQFSVHKARQRSGERCFQSEPESRAQSAGEC